MTHPERRRRRAPRARREADDADRPTRTGGAMRSSTRCTSAASPTRTATESATSRAFASGFRTCAISASTRSGSTRGTPRRWPTRATTSPTTARSTPPSGRSTEAEQLIAEARALGIRTIVDIVPNHVSDQHPWFHDALASPPGSPERERFWFRPGTGPDGELPPNGWQSIFGGSGVDAHDDDGGPASGTSTSSRPSSPTSTGRIPTSGPSTRTSSASGSTAASPAFGSTRQRLLVKDPELAEEIRESAPGRAPVHGPGRAPRHLPPVARDRRQLRRAARSRRRGLATRPGASGPLSPPGRAAHRLQLRLPRVPLGAAAPMRTSIESALASHAPVDAPPTWVLSNHDVTRPVTRYGRADTSFSFESKREGTPTDLERGTRRARAAALLAMALPGSMYIYQGEELGLPEVEDIPSERRQDPMWHRSGGVDPGRDGCRIPLPWDGDGRRTDSAPTGADRPVARPARRLGAAHGRRPVRATATSMLSLYRAGLRLRRAAPWAGDGGLRWLALRRIGSRLRTRTSASPASSTSARTRSRCPPASTSSSPATSSKEVRSRTTPRSGSARRAAHRSRSTRTRTGRRARWCTMKGVGR